MKNSVNRFSSFEHVSGCSCCGGHHDQVPNEISRKKFVQLTGTSALGALALSGLSWSALSNIQADEKYEIKRKALVVKPIFTYETPSRRDQTSWRGWGGIQSEKDAEKERQNIQGELKILKSKADFPVEFLPVTSILGERDIITKDIQLDSITDLQSADVVLVYAAGGGMDVFFDSLNKMGKNMIFFCRYKSGPVYLWYQIISPRFLRKNTDKLAVSGIDDNDVVIDSQDEILWRLRALCGLKNTLNSKIIALGGPHGPVDLVKEKYKLDIQTVSYEEFGKLITEARADKSVVSRARNHADEYLKDKTVKLEIKRQSVENSFILEDVFIRIMEKFECRAFTIANCLRGKVLPLSETTACLPLSLLNDAGYLAFCESDFVVIPAGILLANISNKPVFLNDPTYPHDGIITLAHCTAPRRMDGKKLEPTRLLTHFESDYGAAPKVEMLIGQTVTNIIPDRGVKKNVGLLGKIVDNPFRDICRSQIDISFVCDSKLVAEKMPGFHWITSYGNYIKEFGYALKKIGIDFENLI